MELLFGFRFSFLAVEGCLLLVGRRDLFFRSALPARWGLLDDFRVVPPEVRRVEGLCSLGLERRGVTDCCCCGGGGGGGVCSLPSPSVLLFS